MISLTRQRSSGKNVEMQREVVQNTPLRGISEETLVQSCIGNSYSSWLGTAGQRRVEIKQNFFVPCLSFRGARTVLRGYNFPVPCIALGIAL